MAAVKKDYDFSKAVRGAVVPPTPGQTPVTIALDDDVLDWFESVFDRAGGGDYRALINEILRDYIAARQEPLEETIRRVLREELAAERAS